MHGLMVRIATILKEFGTKRNVNLKLITARSRVTKQIQKITSNIETKQKSINRYKEKEEKITQNDDSLLIIEKEARLRKP